MIRTRAIIKMGKNRDMARIPIKLGKLIKVTGKRVNIMDLGRLLIQMGQSTLAGGRMIRKKEKALGLMLMEAKQEENGKMAI